MKSVNFDILRPVVPEEGATDRTTNYENVGTAYVTYSPVRDVEAELGGSVGRRNKAFQFVAEHSTVELLDGDVLQGRNIKLRVSMVDVYDSEFRRVVGTAEQFSD